MSVRPALVIGQFSSFFRSELRNCAASAPSSARWSQRHAQVGHRADRDRVVAELVGDHDRALDDRLGVEDRDLRLVDHRRGDDRAVAAGVGDRERAAADLVRRRAGSRGRACARSLMRLARPSTLEVLRVADHRHDQAVLAERDRDPEVHAVVGRERLALERRVQRRELAQRLDRRAGDERAGTSGPAACARPRSRDMSASTIVVHVAAVCSDSQHVRGRSPGASARAAAAGAGAAPASARLRDAPRRGEPRLALARRRRRVGPVRALDVHRRLFAAVPPASM